MLDLNDLVSLYHLATANQTLTISLLQRCAQHIQAAQAQVAQSPNPPAPVDSTPPTA